MKAGSFNFNDYIERLTEAAEAKEAAEKEAKPGKGAPTTKAAGGTGEGLIIPEENKKVFGWLKKEYVKGKTEVKVEMKMGGSKFTPGYDMQTDLKSVKDFKPGMFGDVKTGDNEGNGKKVEPGTDGGSVAAGSEKKPGKGPIDVAPDKNGESEAPKKKFGKKGEAAVVTDGEVSEKDEKDEDTEEKSKKSFKPAASKGNDFKKEDKFKKKLKESVNPDLLESNVLYEVMNEGKTADGGNIAFLSNLPMTARPALDELNYIKHIQVDAQLESIINLLPVVTFPLYEDMLSEWGKDFPFSKTFFVAKVEEEKEASFLVRPEGHDYAQYIAELI